MERFWFKVMNGWHIGSLYYERQGELEHGLVRWRQIKAEHERLMNEIATSGWTYCG